MSRVPWEMADKRKLSFDEYDELVNPRPEECDFDRVVESALSRRGFMGGVLAMGSFAALGGSILPTGVKAAANRFAFDAIPISTEDDLIVPAGYKADIVVRWGDPLFADGTEFDHATRGTAATQEKAFGDNNDGMDVFVHDGKMLLVANNEYTNREILSVSGDNTLTDQDEIAKGMMAHGVSIMEIAQIDGRWQIVKDSPYNRRITPQTDMALTGPAAGHDLMKTAADATGTTSKGTWNNCGNGMTPWGTYLACEENFNGYFSAEDENHEVSDELKRYGVSAEDWGYSWAKVDDRFDVAKNPNEPNRAGYVVEIDPTDPTSTPRKLTALGRFKHENAEAVVNNDGRVVVYMGDDERGEFMYRFVSEGVYAPGADTSELLEKGTLSVAKFNDDGTGEWLDLTPETTGMASQAEVCIHARQAGSKVGATTMDRPEWITANPNKAEVYCALTNNKNRGIKPNKGGDETPVGGPNPREANNYGQIVRWWPNDEDHGASGFTWDLYVLAGNPTVHDDANAGSENVNKDNMFNSPDGIKFDSNGLLWIQTDGKYSNEGDFAGQGNNQMLAGDPVTGEIRRFLVGPKECEITGLTWSPDRRTMFVGVQHPGEDGNSHWPEGGNAVPRSAIIAVTREDGGLVG
ncbi:PhoX family protein [Ruegeria sp.]|uniref:PhoX family protein n=1 Tax=Ruegeria sp. TaxID=1879320 RepID=UPI003B58D6DE